MFENKNKFKLAKWIGRKPLSLGTRLFLSHLIVMSVAISILVMVRHTASPILFARQIEKIETKRSNYERIDFQDVRVEIFEGFDYARHNSTLISIIAGGTTAGVLSFLVARRIIKPLVKIERVTQQFARGRLSERLPPQRYSRTQSAQC